MDNVKSVVDTWSFRMEDLAIHIVMQGQSALLT
jgi:hypothetical protein